MYFILLMDISHTAFAFSYLAFYLLFMDVIPCVLLLCFRHNDRKIMLKLCTTKDDLVDTYLVHIFVGIGWVHVLRL